MLSAAARRTASSSRLSLLHAAARRSVATTAFQSSTRCSTISRSATRTIQSTTRRFSTATPAAPVRDFFLDNLGKFFLGAIAAIILSLVRSSYGTSNLQAKVREIEEHSAIDPLEIDELRQANGELTADLFRLIMKELVLEESGSAAWTYEEFVIQVRTILKREKGAHCTIGLGYLLDRVVIAALKDGAVKDATVSSGFDATSEVPEDLTMPLTFWMTVLSLAMNGPVPDRIRVLYELLEQTSSASTDSVLETDDAKKVTLADVRSMVRYLQETCQLVPEKQVIPTDTKYPTQQYRRGNPEELVQWGEAAAAAANPAEVLDIDAFADILQSKSVCAWGECFQKRKYVP